jgi:hypothetical protein
MIHEMIWISSHDTINAPFVLRHIKQGKLVVMDEYQDLVCRKCGKVNEKAALTRGIQPEVVVKSKRPYLLSADDFCLVDERGKDAFSRILPNELEYFPIPSSRFYVSRFYVASARVSLHPVDSDPGYRFLSGRCHECGRRKEFYWSDACPTMEPPSRFTSIIFEDRQGGKETWFVTKDVAEQLKNTSPPLTGIAFLPKEFEDDLRS